MTRIAFVVALFFVVAQSGVEIADQRASAKLFPAGAAVEKLAGGELEGSL